MRFSPPLNGEPPAPLSGALTDPDARLLRVLIRPGQGPALAAPRRDRTLKAAHVGNRRPPQALSGGLGILVRTVDSNTGWPLPVRPVRGRSQPITAHPPVRPAPHPDNRSVGSARGMALGTCPGETEAAVVTAMAWPVAGSSLRFRRLLKYSSIQYCFYNSSC